MATKINEMEFLDQIEKNKLRFYKTAKTILKNEDDTYDALQNALISMYENLNNLKNKNYFLTWAIKIIINKSYDIIRKNNKVVSIPFDESLETLSHSIQDTYTIDVHGLDKILSTIEPNIRLIVTLYYYDDLSIKTISEIMNMPEGTVKTKLAKARNILKEKLEEEGFEYEK